MRASVYHGKGTSGSRRCPTRKSTSPTDALVRITHACVCGSDLWFYRGLEKWQPGYRTGHEWMGVVEEVGPEVRTVKKGDRVIAPFAFSDGTCEFCHEGPADLLRPRRLLGRRGQRRRAGRGDPRLLADGTLVDLPPSSKTTRPGSRRCCR